MRFFSMGLFPAASLSWLLVSSEYYSVNGHADSAPDTDAAVGVDSYQNDGANRAGSEELFLGDIVLGASGADSNRGAVPISSSANGSANSNGASLQSRSRSIRGLASLSGLDKQMVGKLSAEEGIEIIQTQTAKAQAAVDELKELDLRDFPHLEEVVREVITVFKDTKVPVTNIVQFIREAEARKNKDARRIHKSGSGGPAYAHAENDGAAISQQNRRRAQGNHSARDSESKEQSNQEQSNNSNNWKSTTVKVSRMPVGTCTTTLLTNCRKQY
jgi:hypothetical protein